MAKITQAVSLRRRLADRVLRGLAGLTSANSLNAQSTCLAKPGRHEQALVCRRTRLSPSYRRAEATPGPDAFRAKLALSLNNQSICLGNLGHHDEALKASEEAVAIYGDLGETAAVAHRVPELSQVTGQSGRRPLTSCSTGTPKPPRLGPEAGSLTGTP